MSAAKARKAKHRAAVKTYPATINGRRVRVTIPEDPTPEEVLRDALRANLSPAAVAAIAAYLQPAHTKDASVNRQLAWFQDLLVEALGGDEAFNRIADEVGL